MAAGADLIAHGWWESQPQPRCQLMVFHPEWDKFGKAAGPMRNRRMLEEGKPDIVVAFPGGKGTANMVMLARAAGVAVKIITEPS